MRCGIIMAASCIIMSSLLQQTYHHLGPNLTESQHLTWVLKEPKNTTCISTQSRNITWIRMAQDSYHYPVRKTNDRVNRQGIRQSNWIALKDIAQVTEAKWLYLFVRSLSQHNFLSVETGKRLNFYLKYHQFSIVRRLEETDGPICAKPSLLRQNWNVVRLILY